VNPYVEHAKEAAGRPVRASPEFRRIDALPRRLAVEVPEGWGDRFRKPGGTLTLRPVQAQALFELQTLRRLMAPIPVGGGKELVSLLAAVALGLKSVAILVPHALRKQLLERDIPHYGAHFFLPEHIHVVSYSTLSSKAGAGVLDTLSPLPEVVVLNEAHCVGGRSARTRRWRRWRKAHPKVVVVPMSGTFEVRSIKEAAPLAEDALGAYSPYPRDWSTLDAWSWALDDGVLFEGEPGVLETWCRPGESVKAAWGRRVSETPGVVGGVAASCPASLYFHHLKPKVPPAIKAALARLESHWELPDGSPLDSPLAKHQAETTLSNGYYLRRTWPREEPTDLRARWSDALKEWNAEVRAVLARGGRAGFDSPGLLEDAARRGDWASSTYARWAEVKGTCKPSSEAVWVDDFLVGEASKWALKHRGLVWVDGPDLGLRIADTTGLPYYGGGGADPSGETGHRSIVLSINAYQEGLNLQKAYGEALYCCVPLTSKVWEQSVGRIHRPGQPRTEVNIYIYVHVVKLDAALGNALHTEQRQGFTPKLRLGTHLA
jgi:hypothetical protein